MSKNQEQLDEEFKRLAQYVAKVQREDVYVCHDCGVEEGEIHHLMCDMEVCPWCGGQLISCGCEGSSGDGLTGEEWRVKLERKGRVPYVQFPAVCDRCGVLHPQMFKVPDEEWNAYMRGHAKEGFLCRECYDWIKAMIDKGKEARDAL